jgi:hypothetical protein
MPIKLSVALERPTKVIQLISRIAQIWPEVNGYRPDSLALPAKCAYNLADDQL